MKKTAALLLAMVLLAGCAAACGGRPKYALPADFAPREAVADGTLAEKTTQAARATLTAPAELHALLVIHIGHFGCLCVLCVLCCIFSALRNRFRVGRLIVRSSVSFRVRVLIQFIEGVVRHLVRRGFFTGRSFFVFTIRLCRILFHDPSLFIQLIKTVVRQS